MILLSDGTGYGVIIEHFGKIRRENLNPDRLKLQTPRTCIRWPMKRNRSFGHHTIKTFVFYYSSNACLFQYGSSKLADVSEITLNFLRICITIRIISSLSCLRVSFLITCTYYIYLKLFRLLEGNQPFQGNESAKINECEVMRRHYIHSRLIPSLDHIIITYI